MREWKRLCHARLFGMALTLFPRQLSPSCPRTAELGQRSRFCKLQTSGDIPLGSVGHRLFAPRAELGPGTPWAAWFLLGLLAWAHSLLAGLSSGSEGMDYKMGGQ